MKNKFSSRGVLYTLLILLLLLVAGNSSAARLQHQSPRSQPAAQEPVSQAAGSVAVCQAGNIGGSARVYLPLVVGGGAVAAQTQSTATTHTALASAATADGTLALQLAYIHGGDSETAAAYQSILAAHDITLVSYPQSEIAQGDFSNCDGIVVGADTTGWSDPSPLIETDLPVTALGDGGLAFLETAGLLTGIGSGSDSGDTVAATLRGLAAYQFPNAMGLAPDDTVQLFTAAFSTNWLNLPDPLPDGMEIGRFPDSSHYPIVQIEGQYLLWGFNHSPGQLSASGQELLANVLSFQGQDVQVPLRTRHFIPPAGIEQALQDKLASTPLPNLHVYVQFKEKTNNPNCADPANLTAAGLTDFSYLWGKTYTATMAKNFNASHPLVNDCLRWLGLVLPQDKVMPDVAEGNFAEWANNGDGTVGLLVGFFADVPPAEADGILETHTISHTVHAPSTWAVVMAPSQITPLSQNDRVSWIQQGPMPLFIDNDTARQELFVDDVQQANISGSTITYNGLDGSSVQAIVMEGRFDDSHPDFNGRIISSRTGSLSDHATHVAGIIGADGSSSAGAGGTAFQWRGMAPGVELGSVASSGGSNIFRFVTAYNTLGGDISNHSYTQTCMLYDSAQEAIDVIIRGDFEGYSFPPFIEIPAIPARPYHKSAGNNGTGSQWCDVGSSEGVRGYYSVTGVAKNQTVIGALNPSSDYRLRSGSSRGPTYDGRIKPDVMAIGQERSTVANALIDSNNDGFDDFTFPYDTMGGTSMAAPATTGVAALALQQYKHTYGITNPLPATVKALLINNATDLVNDPNDTANYSAYSWNDPDTSSPVIYHQGPDFATGYGVVHARRTVNAVQHKAVIEGTLNSAGQVDDYTIQVLPGREELRFTLAWDDPAADAGLAEDATHLVNDLDLVLIDPNGGLHYPWVVDPLPASTDFGGTTADPIATADVDPAYRAADHRNNVEQVVVWADDVDAADWTGTWTVRVSASGLPIAPQPYSLVGEWRQITLQNVFPMDGGYNLAPDAVIMPVYVRNPHLTATGAAGGIDAGNWQVRLRKSATDPWIDADVEAAYGPVGDLVHLVVRPPGTVDAGFYYDVEVTLLDAYQVNQHVAEADQVIDTASYEDAIFFLAEPRPPVDEMVVVDNSGSMADNNKLLSAQNAARAFTDRRQEGDMIGLAYFETIADTLYQLKAVSASETELDDVKAEINNMVPLDRTALGPGLLEGKNELDTRGSTDHTWHLVVLSDGMENVPPCWDVGPGNPYCEGQTSVQSDFVPLEGCPDITIDTVIVGPDDANWRELLEDIANKTCGEPWHATVDDGGVLAARSATTPVPATTSAATMLFPESLQNTLADIYISIADDNTHQQRLWEEAGYLPVGAVIQREIVLESGLPEATLAVNWPDGNYMRVDLIRPSGVKVNPTDSDAHVKSDGTHTIFRMDAPVAGQWKLQLGGAQGGANGAEYLAIVSANTDVMMFLDFGLPVAQRVVGAEMPIYVALVDEVGSLTGATVELAIDRPGGIDAPLTMYDDGSHGDNAANDGVYTTLYTIPQAGNYQVKAHAEGTAHDGEPFLRYRMRHFHVDEPRRVLYIYKSDKATGEQVEKLLEGNGMIIDLAQLPDVHDIDLTPYDLLIIAADTGLDSSWGDSATIAHIVNSRKKVMGLGDGGYAYFGKLGLDIGFNNGIKDSDAFVQADDTLHAVWNMPYDVPWLTDDLVSVYKDNGSPGVMIDLVKHGPNVEPLGQKPYSGGDTYWLARENNRYLLWGFNHSPQAMTNSGKELFVNAAWYALH